MKDFKKIAILGVPQDLGASRRGVDMGASAIRIAGLSKILTSKLGYSVHDHGNIRCHDIEEHFVFKNENLKLRHLDHIMETSELMKGKISEIYAEESFPLILGGDHSINIGTLAGLRNNVKGKIGLIWVDAHGDFNTAETTSSGNIHGMPFAVATGRGDKKLLDIGNSPTVSEENCVLIGARDVDYSEGQLLNESEVTVFTMKDIDEKGFARVANQAIEIATSNVDHLHFSFDIDALDPTEAPGTGTSVPGGLTYREAHLLAELVHNSDILGSMEVVEINPTLDIENKTAKLAVGLIASVLGKKIM
ncbi:MAG: arginase [Candidatus Hodarchaeales archaeon]|jgi:arginase